jgi:hypothetical protein
MMNRPEQRTPLLTGAKSLAARKVESEPCENEMNRPARRTTPTTGAKAQAARMVESEPREK